VATRTRGKEGLGKKQGAIEKMRAVTSSNYIPEVRRKKMGNYLSTEKETETVSLWYERLEKKLPQRGAWITLSKIKFFSQVNWAFLRAKTKSKGDLHH